MYAPHLSFDFVKNCVHLKSLESNKRKHVDWYNKLVNEENISCRSSRSDTLDYAGKRILFTFLTGWFCACGSSSWIMKHANGNEAVLCQIILWLSTRKSERSVISAYRLSTTLLPSALKFSHCTLLLQLSRRILTSAPLFPSLHPSLPSLLCQSRKIILDRYNRQFVGKTDAILFCLCQGNEI
jgi:hypothetical protein